MNHSLKSLLLLCVCLWCAEVQAQPVRTVFVAKEPYKQLYLYIPPSSIDISLNGRVKSVEQTSNVYLVHVLSGGGMTSASYQQSHYLQYIFDSLGNLESYKSKYIYFDTNTVEASVEKALPIKYFRQPTEQYTIEDDKSYFFKDGLLTKEKDGSTTNLYEYDEHGNLICIKEYHGNFWPRTTTVSLNENGLPLTVTVHDPSNTHNQQEKDKENIPDNATDMLCYDAEGNCTAHLQKCYNGWRMDVYEYDRSGNLIFEGPCEKYSKSNPCGCKKSRINHGYEYDSQNNRIRDYLIGDWKPSKWDRSFKYDTAGREIEYTTYETSGKQRTLSSHVTTTYDSLGRIVCKEAFTGFYVSNEALFNYSRVVKQTWEYDARGNIICLKAYKDKSKPFKVVRYEYVYDDHDNWIQCRRHEGESEDSMPVTQTLERVICYY
jgi:YD repeat-containing protein